MITVTTTANGLGTASTRATGICFLISATLYPVKQALSANVDISVRTSGVSDYFPVLYGKGYINDKTPENAVYFRNRIRMVAVSLFQHLVTTRSYSG